MERKKNTEWISDRKRQEIEDRERIDLFDRFVDFALDGLVTMEQAISGYKETCEAEGIPLSPRTSVPVATRPRQPE